MIETFPAELSPDILNDLQKCPRCDRRLVEIGDNKRFLECFCGYKFDTYLSNEVTGIKAPFEEEERLYEEITVKQLQDILGQTIKRDSANKVIVFLCELSAYLDEPFNVKLSSESSTGKSYIPLEISRLFPDEDVIELAYSSRTAFIHGKYKEEVAEDGTTKRVVDLKHKILIFIDQPHNQTLEMMRPILSHDRKELVYKVTDRNSSGSLKAKEVTIRGFPSVLFCSGKLSNDDQEATRLILLSPEIDSEKFREGIVLAAKKSGDKAKFEEWLNEDVRRMHLVQRIRDIKHSGIEDVNYPYYDVLANLFIQEKELDGKNLAPRHMRDMTKLMSLIKALALLNFYQRERDGNVLIADIQDAADAFLLYASFSESQDLGVSQYVYEFYQKLLIPLSKLNPDGFSFDKVMRMFHQKNGRNLPEWKLRGDIIPALESAGLIALESDGADKRKKLIVVLSEQREPSASTPEVTS